MSLNRYLVNDAHERHFVVTHDTGGWNVIEKQDSTVLRRIRRRIWQGVEREIQRFGLAADELKRRGWIEYPSDRRSGRSATM
jgi:hypothetical protein